MILRAQAILLTAILLSACGGDGPSASPGSTGGASATGSGAGGGGLGGGGASSSTSGGSSPGGGGAGGEVDPPGEPDCHPHEPSTAHGAYFRKVTAEPSTAALALHASGRLPRVSIDHARWFTAGEPGLQWQNGPLDRPSVYMGGRASNVEVDAGLTWDRVYHADGRPTWTDVLESGSDEGDPAHRFVVGPGNAVTSVTGVPRPEGLEGLVENFAFRPFWRAEGAWHNPTVGSPDNVYFFPREAIRMQIKSIGAETLELAINSSDDDSKTFSVTFSVSGWGIGAAQSFKRVSSIDQFTVIDGKRVGLESAGLDVLPTATKARDGRWDEVSVLGTGGTLLFHLDCSRPAVVGSDAVVQASYDDIFRLFDQDSLGAEELDILPPE